jgi:uncharacterized OB-fold protein
MAEAHAQAAERLSLRAQKDALREGRLVGLECRECRERHFTPAVRCRNGHAAFRVKEFAKEGRVASYTIQLVAPEAFLNEVPFAWVVVDLDEGGPRVSGWIPFVAKPEELQIGQRVRFAPSYKPGMMFEKV